MYAVCADMSAAEAIVQDKMAWSAKGLFYSQKNPNQG